MKLFWTPAITLVLVVQAVSAQSLGELARKERERKAQEQKSSVPLTTDEIKLGKFDVSPSLDPARKGDLDYLLQRLSHPKASPELLMAFTPMKDRALPRLLPMLGSTDPLKRVAPATALIVLGSSEGLASMARLLDDATESAASAAAGQAAVADKTAGAAPAPSSDEALRRKIEMSRIFAYALDGAKLGLWRFTEGSSLAPQQVAERLKSGPPVEVVGGPDGGQKIFSHALRDPDPNIRRGAIALVRIATEGSDYGFDADQTGDKNEPAIQQITSFLTTERGKVMAQLGAKNP